MTTDSYLDLLIAVFSLLAALFWFRSSRVRFQFGWDMDQENQKSANKLSFWNMLAAIFAGLAALVASAKYFLGFAISM